MFKIGYDKKITMVQGDTGVIRMRISNYELSQGDEVRFAIANKANPSILLCQHSDKKIVLEKQVTVFEKDGSARIVIYPYDTEYLQPGKYLYEIQVKTKDGRIDTVVPLTSFTLMDGSIQGEYGQTTPSKPEPTPSEIELRFKRLENEIIPELGNRITNVENEIDSIILLDTIKPSSNAMIKILKDNYNISSIIYGDNTEIDFNNSTVKGCLHFKGNNIRFKNLNCSSNNNDDDFAIIIEGNNIVGENIKVNDTKNGVVIKNSNSCEIKNITLNTVNASAITIWNSENIIVNNIKVENAVWGINIQTGTKNIKINNSHFILSNTDDSVFYKTAEHGAYAHHFENIEFNSCLFKGWNRSGSCGIKLRDGKNVIINNCIIEESNNDLGLYIQENLQLEGVYVNNCKFIKSSAHYVFLRDYSEINNNIDVTIKNCEFNHDLNINNYNGVGALKFIQCNFKGQVVPTGTANRELKIINSNFINSLKSGYRNALFINGLTNYSIGIEENCFYNWGESIDESLSWDYKELYRSAIGIRNSKKITVLNNKFSINDKRAVSVIGSSAGYCDVIYIINNVGGNEIYGFMSGEKLKNYVIGNIIYKGIATTSFYNSANNNVSIKDDNSIVLF